MDIDLRNVKEGDKIHHEGKEYTVVRVASGTAKNPTSNKRARGYSHVLATTDGGPALLYQTCSCSAPGEVVHVLDLVTESVDRICGKCRALYSNRFTDWDETTLRILPRTIIGEGE